MAGADVELESLFEGRDVRVEKALINDPSVEVEVEVEVITSFVRT